jgi:hypothetical protein
VKPSYPLRTTAIFTVLTSAPLLSSTCNVNNIPPQTYKHHKLYNCHRTDRNLSRLTMADMLGAGAMNGFPLEQWFWEMPPLTRWWTTSAVLCSVLVQCHIISPFNLFYSVRAVFSKGQVSFGSFSGNSTAYEELSTNRTAVLATPKHILLLRAPLSRPYIPHLLPPAILAPLGRNIRTLACALQLSPYLRGNMPPLHCSLLQHRFPRFST